MELTQIAKEKLSNSETRMKVALELKKSYPTLSRWIGSPVHENLTTRKSIDAIEKFTGLTEEEIFEPEA